MKTTLIIGAGAAGSVTLKKCLMNAETFGELHLASRTLSKCQKLKDDTNGPFKIHQIDADDTEDLIKLMQKINPTITINMALPYQDLSIMKACLAVESHYVDTANYEPKDEAKFSYKEQWAMNDEFKAKNLIALLGSGFDPGVTGVFTAYAQKHLFDEIHEIDIIDCNDGSHGHPFATNFNPEINIREVTQKGKYWQNGHWIETAPMEISKDIDFPELGPRKGYLLYHEELESLVKNVPHLQKIRFWMTFSDSYITHLNVLQNIGMTGIKPIDHNGQKIIPLEFLKTILPNPSELGENYNGKTCIGCVFQGIKDGNPTQKTIYNITQHQTAYKETAAQAVSYTTGVPAMIGAKLILDQKWTLTGTRNIEEFNPDPFMTELNNQGLPWKTI